MDKEQIKRINRNNRKRGSKFEKTVADYLDMDVVPYSGSNSRFGFGDIRDSIWLGECKNTTAKDGNIILTKEWIEKNEKRATESNRIPFLAFMEKGGQDKYVAVDINAMKVIIDKYKHSLITGTCTLKCKHNTVNFIIPIDSLKLLRPKFGVMSFIMDRTQDTLYIMNLGVFRMIRINEESLKGKRSEDVGDRNKE